jgi:hypothetical protein
MKLVLVPFVALSAVMALGAEKPVTVGELSQTVAKVEPILRRTLGLPMVAVKVKPGSTMATRAQILAEMDRFFILAWPKLKLTPVPASVNLKRFGLTDPKARMQAIRLIQFGALAPVGPLVTGPEKGLSPHQFGDAMGYFLARVAELTHTPSNEFTPALMDN